MADGIWSGAIDADAQDDDTAPTAAATPELEAELVAMRHRAELAD